MPFFSRYQHTTFFGLRICQEYTATHRDLQSLAHHGTGKQAARKKSTQMTVANLLRVGGGSIFESTDATYSQKVQGASAGVMTSHAMRPKSPRTTFENGRRVACCFGIGGRFNSTMKSVARNA